MENIQPKELCSQIKIMKAFEEDTNYKLKTLEENDTEDTMEKYIKVVLHSIRNFLLWLDRLNTRRI